MSKRSSGDYVKVALFDGDGNSGDSDLEHIVHAEHEVPTEPVNQKDTSLCGLQYYQKFFDVDTTQVFERLKMSVLPLSAKRFVQHIQPHGDLYGPFWVATTLIVSTMISGDFSRLLLANEGVTSTHHFGRVTSTSMLIFLYCCAIPFGIMAFLYLRTPRVSNAGGTEDTENLIADASSTQHTSVHLHTNKFFELLCVYGYSLAVFIPTTILWGISNPMVQWILLVVAVVVSGGFLFLVLLPGFRRDRPLMAIPTIVTILVIQVVFGVALLLLFSHGVSGSSSGSVVHQAVLPPAPADAGAVNLALGDAGKKDSHVGQPVVEKAAALLGKA